jgi:hypothetical protein
VRKRFDASTSSATTSSATTSSATGLRQAQPADLAKKEFYEGKKDWEVWEDWEKNRPDRPKALIAFSPAPSLSHEDTKKKGVCGILIMDKERTEGVKSFIPY